MTNNEIFIENGHLETRLWERNTLVRGHLVTNWSSIEKTEEAAISAIQVLFYDTRNKSNPITVCYSDKVTTLGQQTRQKAVQLHSKELHRLFVIARESPPIEQMQHFLNHYQPGRLVTEYLNNWPAQTHFFTLTTGWGMNNQGDEGYVQTTLSWPRKHADYDHYQESVLSDGTLTLAAEKLTGSYPLITGCGQAQHEAGFSQLMM